MERARVLLAEDHADVAEQLRVLMEPEFEVVTTVADGYAMLGAARALRPDVIVADIAMPLLDGMSAAAEVLRDDPAARVVFVSVHRDAALVQQCMAVGALGYVSKLTAGNELLPALRAALRGERCVSV
jgi:DNA-binding NarL/FixJ family response regulator